MEQRILYYDILNVVSCIGVVCLHCNGYVHDFVKDDWWWLRVLIEVSFYFAVPVFFMLSGATLLDYKEKYSTKAFYKKRFVRTFIPFVIWSTFFLILWAIIKGPETLHWKNVIYRYSFGYIPYANYWFFIPLFLIYIFMPFFSLMKSSMTLKHIMFLCILLGTFQVLLPTLYSIIGIEYDFSLPIGSYVIYFFLGYYISHSTIENNNRVFFITGLLAFISIIVRYKLLYYSDAMSPVEFTYLGPYAIFPAMFIFMAGKRYEPVRYSKKTTIWQTLSSKSLGVYLIHTALISLVGKVISRKDIIFIPISLIVAYIFSVIFVYYMQKNQLLKKIVP